MAGQYGTLGDVHVIRDIIFTNFCAPASNSLTIDEIQALYSTIRADGMNKKQIASALAFMCGTDYCDKEDLLDVLKELDRRYYLLQDLRWEFDLLDLGRKGSISSRNAFFLLKMVHGEDYTKGKWKTFLNNREVPGADVSFEEIEVDLCSFFFPGDDKDIDDAEERKRAEEDKRNQEEMEAEVMRQAEEQRRREARLKKEQEARAKAEAEKKAVEAKKEAEKHKDAEKQRKLDEEKKKQLEEQKRLDRQKQLEEDKERQIKEEALKKDEEERKRKEEEERKLAEEEENKRQKEEELKRLELEEEERKKKDAIINWKKAQLLEQQQAEMEKMKNLQEMKAIQDQQEAEMAEVDADNAAEAEEKAREEALKMAELAKQAEDEESRRKAEEAEKKALAEARESKVKRLKLNLKAATKSRKIPRIKDALQEAKDAKLTGFSEEIDEAEKVLDLLVSGEQLEDAMLRRHLGDIQKSAENIKKKGYTKEYAIELLEAEKLSNKLRRLERLRKEILELNQSTISEIRSYQKPPRAVHQVMIAVYLILGLKEKELKEWKYMQALLGKTGKEGLKRQVTQLEPIKINLEVATYADKQYLKEHDLDSIRDVSAGAATFFMWCNSMIEEANACKEESAKRKQIEEQRRKEEEEEKKKMREKQKLREQQKKQGGKTPADGIRQRKKTPPARQPSDAQLRRGRSVERKQQASQGGARRKTSSLGPKKDDK